MNPNIPQASIRPPAIFLFLLTTAPPTIPNTPKITAPKPRDETVEAPEASKALPIPPTTTAKIPMRIPKIPPITPKNMIMFIVLFFLGYWAAHLDLSQVDKTLSHVISNTNESDSSQAVSVMSQATSDYIVTIDSITTDTFERMDMRYITSYNASILEITIQNTCDKPITIDPNIGHISYYDEAGKPDLAMNEYCLIHQYGTLTKRINENDINEIRMFGFSTQTILPRASFSYQLPFSQIDFSN